jgi:hypothetical protein
MSDAETQQVATLLRGLTKQYPRSRYAKIFRKQIDALDEKDRRDSTSQK